MSGNFDGGHGMYGSVMLGALMELGKMGDNRPKGQAGSVWKRVVLVLAVVVTPVALLLVGGLGS